MSKNIVVMGSGQIGRAVAKLVLNSVQYPDVWIWDKVDNKIDLVDTHIIDLEDATVEYLTSELIDNQTDYVVNALPFFLNEKIAQAAANAGCSYIDFTEDDQMADKVQAIYRNHPNLSCAVKCGLAPGFINYLGHHLVSNIISEGGKCSSLMISVGALPRNVNGTRPADLYNISWSVDGLVNEYIRPCRVRHGGKVMEIEALTGIEKVIADGVEYEAAYTSGGIGSLISELKHVPNVAYKTLRYPTHYDYVRDVVARHHREFEPIKEEFLKVFPFNTDDVIVVYAEAKGKDKSGRLVRQSRSYQITGINDLSAIQTTTASGGVAVLELMESRDLSGIINHADISLDVFMSTVAATNAYGYDIK
jgi:saccharopine dehydrogenase-like NADP-dependent oxidoreductase